MDALHCQKKTAKIIVDKESYYVLEVKENWAEIEVAGAKQRVTLQLFPEVKAGDWVLVNLGFVVAKIEEGEKQLG